MGEDLPGGDRSGRPLTGRRPRSPRSALLDSARRRGDNRALLERLGGAGMSSQVPSERARPTRERLRRERSKRARNMRLLYVFFLVPVALLFVFHYIPMYGVLIAFKDFRIASGILH